MTQEPVASLVLEGSDKCRQSDTVGSVAIDINLFDGQLRGRILVDDRPAGLADVVPIARTLTDEIVRRVVCRSERSGVSVQCRKGCAACCRYMVPLSVPEIYRLWDEIQSFPAERRQRILSGCLEVSRKILESEPVPVTQTPGDEPADAEPDALDRWYAGIDSACPLLEGEVCTIYPLRPVSCREHIAITPAEYCRPTNPGHARLLKPPLSVIESLGRLAAEMEGTEIEAILLPLAPAWRDVNRNRAVRQWPAPVLFERFADIVHDMSRRQAAAA